MINTAVKFRSTNIDRIAQLRCISSATAIDFWKEVCSTHGHDLSTYDVLMLLLAQGERASTIAAHELATAAASSSTEPEETVKSLASPINEPSSSMLNAGRHTMPNIDKIAQLRRVDTAAALDFWKQVCATVRHGLSTYDVLMLLLDQGERASTIAAHELATASPSSTQPEEAAQSLVSPINEPSPSRHSETLRVIAEPAVTNDLHNTRNYNAAKYREGLADKHDLSPIESNELHNLLKDMLPMGFTHSKQLSNYIVNNKLGYKYPNISGIVRMEGEGAEWDFSGGFPKRIYAIICKELGLFNQGTSAKAIGFISFKEIQSKRDK